MKTELKITCTNCHKDICVDFQVVPPNKARNLRIWRKNTGMTMKEAGETFKVSEGFWSLMEAGKRNIPDHIASKIPLTP